MNHSLFIAFILFFSFNLFAWNSSNTIILKGDIVTMDESKQVINNGTIIIIGNKIDTILKSGESIPSDINESSALKVNTDGWIFPGLIDAHNHVAYNFLPLYDVPKKYENRYQWNKPKTYRQFISYPKNLLCKKSYYNMADKVVKYSEVKALTGGVTAIQGTPNLNTIKYLVRNVEFKNFGADRVDQRVTPLSDPRFVDYANTKLLPKMNNDELDAWLPHVGEGVDSSSRAEYKILKDLNLINDITVCIHSTALHQDDFHEMGESGTKIVWSPLSNLLLYGETTDIPAALQEGVNVSLGADWAPSGCKNLLGSIKIAHNIDSLRYGDVISDTLLIEMVTTNPALALGFEDEVGSLKPGMYADIAVYDKISDNPYKSLIQSTETHVQLVLIDGEPLYGDKSIMNNLKSDDYEIIGNLNGREKALDITNPDFPNGKQTFSEIKGALESAMKFDLDSMYESFSYSGTKEEFQAYMNEKFKDGIFPTKLDPIYALGDTTYFRKINSSTIANLGFDLSKYWNIESTDSQKVDIFTFLNSESTTLETLDNHAALDKRAATNIINYRNGVDNTFGTSDDNLIETIEELDEIKYVGIVSIEKIQSYVNSLSSTEPITEDQKIFNFLNASTTNVPILDIDAGLRKNTAISIIAYRNGNDLIFNTSDDNPIESFEELDGIKYVGSSAITKIKDFVKGQ